jgi:hypothetical protein
MMRLLTLVVYAFRFVAQLLDYNGRTKGVLGSTGNSALCGDPKYDVLADVH